jgi:hypothetical protein
VDPDAWVVPGLPNKESHMPTSARTHRSSTTQSGRFARPGAGRSSASRPKVSRGATPQQRRRAVGIRRQPPQQSRMKKAFSAVSGAVPGLGGKKKSSRPFGGGKKSSSSVAGSKTGKAGGVAVLTAAAGIAYSNRDKVTSMLRRKGSDQGSTPQVTNDASFTTGAGTSSPSVPPRA